MPKTFYITTPIYYPNADLHIGHAYTSTLSDAVARQHRLIGEEVNFLSGTDDHAIKVAKAAQEAGQDPRSFVLDKGRRFKELYQALNISVDDFIQTSDRERHWAGAQLIWRKISERGDLEKRSYRGLYCIGCEAFKKEEDLVDGKCSDHDQVPQVVEEENWFFLLSRYADRVKSLIISDEFKIIPASRRNEILALLDRGLEDVSFSRPVKSVAWGIPVPDDAEQTMYVWCDALTNYLTALGYGSNDESNFTKFWPAQVHVIGKDILRFHAAIWPAMLLSAGLPLPKTLFVHGFITSGGRKMSKTLGNVVNPFDLLKEYGTDAVRYFLLRHISPFEDGDLTLEIFKENYNAHLANGLGNLVSRVMKLAQTHLTQAPVIPDNTIPQEFMACFEHYDIQVATNLVWQWIGELDQFIQTTKPFQIVKTDPVEGKRLITEMVIKLYTIARMLNPLMPETSETIKQLVKANRMPDQPLFLRKD